MTTISTTGSTAFNPSIASGRQHRPHMPPAALDAAAGKLGLSSDDLSSELKSGKTLADIAKDKGVSTDDLTKTIADALKADKPADAPTLSDDQLNQMAANIVAGTGPQGAAGASGAHRHGGHHHHKDSDADSSSDTTSLASDFTKLAGDLGVSADDLLDQLGQGNLGALSSLRSGDDSTGYGSSSSSSATALLFDYKAGGPNGRPPFPLPMTVIASTPAAPAPAPLVATGVVAIRPLGSVPPG